MAYFSPFDDVDYQVYIDTIYLSNCKESLLFKLYEHNLNNNMNILKTPKGAILLIDIDKEILILFAKILVSMFDYEIILEIFGEFVYRSCSSSEYLIEYNAEHIYIEEYNTCKMTWKNIILASKLKDKLNMYNISNDFIYYKENNILKMNLSISQTNMFYKIQRIRFNPRYKYFQFPKFIDSELEDFTRYCINKKQNINFDCELINELFNEYIKNKEYPKDTLKKINIIINECKKYNIEYNDVLNTNAIDLAIIFRRIQYYKYCNNLFL